MLKRNMGSILKNTLMVNHDFKIFRCFSRKNRRSVHPHQVSPSLNVPQFIEKPPKPFLNMKNCFINSDYIDLKTGEQILKMKDACKMASEILEITASKIQDGITTNQLDIIAHELCIARNCYPAPLHYKKFPKSICTSVNNVVCHGIPDGLILLSGDIINIDVTVYYKGYHGDLSKTYEVGGTNSHSHLINMNEFARDEAISRCGPNVPFNSIGNTIQSIADESNLSVIPYFCGHGIGTYFHGAPDIYHFANEEKGLMKTGMTFTIEPIFCDGSPEIEILLDDWTAVTVDNSWSAQCEHTVLITENGCDILTVL